MHRAMLPMVAFLSFFAWFDGMYASTVNVGDSIVDDLRA